jgi:hypothetical protein
MELSTRTILLVCAYGFVSLAFVNGMAGPPALPSQTAQELIKDACDNELQRSQNRTLWSYTAERHTHDHVFREQVIETVDAPVHHLLTVDGRPPTSAQMKEENDRNQQLLNNASRRHALQKQQGRQCAPPWNQNPRREPPIRHAALQYLWVL